MMTYEETIEYLYNRMPLFQIVGKSAYKEGLDSIIALDNHIKNPHKAFKCIHVGGTNGKGSTSHSIASILQTAGYKVGLFTSPHLKDFRERIRVNGEMISKDFVISFVEKNKNFFEKIFPSFFEVNFAMAEEYFKEMAVDVAVIEVGLGGRLDSTNIINPILSIITNISMDHMNILGNTELDIAKEKAGIIKPQTPVVIGEAQGEIKKLFINKAKEQNAPIFFADSLPSKWNYELIEKDNTYQAFNINNEIYETPLMGIYQQKNITTTVCAIDTLRKFTNLNITKDDEKEGLKNTITQTHLLGRWQKLGEEPLIICDTGHNVGGISYVTEQLKRTPHNRLHIVFGMVGDKDVSHVLELLPKDATYYFTRASIKRAMPESQLQSIASEKGLKGNAYHTVEDALVAAKRNASNKDLIYIGGSTYLVAEVL